MRAYLLSMLLVVGVVGLVPRTVRAQEPCPEHMDPTIAAWSQCVNHAIEMGHIDNQGIANGLLSKLDAAQAAEDRGQDRVAVSILTAFIQQVEAQTGKHINAAHAEHMVMHAEDVIAALGS